MGRTYSLNGIPSDLLSSNKEGLRRLKVDNSTLGTQRDIVSESGDFTPRVGEICMITQISFMLPAPSSIAVNGEDIISFTDDSDAINKSTFFSGNYVKFDLSKIGTYIRLTENDTITGGVYLGYYELTQEQTFENFNVIDGKYITTDGEEYIVRKTNPYLGDK